MENILPSKVAGVEMRAPRISHNMSINEGPADIIAKTVGGLHLTSDVHLLQKQQTFNRSKNLERMVHPCGSGAFGYFECTQDVSDLTKADFLQSPGSRTPIFIRFSTVTLGREFPDEARNPRVFAIKFYTREGNYDIVGLNLPIFFCRDPIQGPDVIRSQARNPKNFLLDYDATFDLLGNTPEGNHAGLMFFSDHGTPDGWTNEHGYGCHTFKWVNKQGKYVYIKYHFLAKHGQKQLTEPEAIRICGENPDYSKQQLWESIEAGREFEWTAKVQIMQAEEADAERLGFDPFDVTKVWPRRQFPMHEFGKLNPENFHRDVEQAAFSPGSMVPGIEDSPDPLLQFRMFFYRDAQYHRIGVNLHQIPVNCPFAAQAVSSINFDGPMCVDANHAGNKQYNPNSFADKFRNDAAEPPNKVSDNVVSRKSHYHHEGKPSEYDQPRELYRRVMDERSRANLHSNTAKMAIYNIAPEYAEGVYRLTVFKHEPFDFSEIEPLAREAAVMSKTKMFRPEQGNRLVGFAPEKPFYQV